MAKRQEARDARGMTGPRLLADFATPDDYLEIYDQEVSAGGMVIRGAELPEGAPLSDCTLVVCIAGDEVAALPARLAAATPGVGVTVIFPVEPVALVQLAARLRLPAPAPLPAKHQLLGPQEKLRLAGSCDRELRFQLLRDPNKQLQALVLKNPRITLEEVHWAARQSTLLPEALKVIAEHAEWSQNPAVATALVRNAKTPVPLALKLLARLPITELRLLAKSQGRAQIVQAAKKALLR